MYFIRLLKQHYKTFLGSMLLWFLLLFLYNFLDARYQIYARYLSKLTYEFKLTTALGLGTTIVTSFYAAQKSKIKSNEETLKRNKEEYIEAVRRLEDMIDSQTFEMRRLDEFNNNINEFKVSLKDIEKQFLIIQTELERQKEQIAQGDKVLLLSTLIREDLQEREQLKVELRDLIKKISGNV